jgi:hypothetical protein
MIHLFYLTLHVLNYCLFLCFGHNLYKRQNFSNTHLDTNYANWDFFNILFQYYLFNHLNSIMKKFLHGTRGYVNQLHNSTMIGLASSKIVDILKEKRETTTDLNTLDANYKITDFYSALTKENNFEKMNPMETDSNKYKSVLESLVVNLINNRVFQRSLVKNNSKKKYRQLIHQNIV